MYAGIETCHDDCVTEYFSHPSAAERSTHTHTHTHTARLIRSARQEYCWDVTDLKACLETCHDEYDTAVVMHS